MVLTATSMNRGETAGKLVFLDKTNFDKVCEMEIGSSHAIRALWHPKLNQMIVGSGDGVVRMYYDPDRSLNGAKLCVVKTKTKAKTTHYVATQQIITPYSLPMFRLVHVYAASHGDIVCLISNLFHCMKGGTAKIDQEASGKGETRPCQIPPAGDAARHEGHGRTSADCRNHAAVLHVETGKSWECGSKFCLLRM